MQSYAFVGVLHLWMLLHVFIGGFRLEDDLERNAKDEHVVSGLLACRCGSKTTQERHLDASTAVRMFHDVAYSRDPSKIKKYPVIRELQEKCWWCELAYSTCDLNNSPLETYKPFHYCDRKSVEFAITERFTKVGKDRNYFTHKRHKRQVEQSAENVSQIINIPIGGIKSPRRQLRYADTCPFPTSLETADISCRVYPSSIKCVERCAYGYTLGDSIRQHLECIFKDNKWFPTGFKECQPFVDCTLSLITGGSLKCSSMSLTRGTECKVECLHYEDKPAVPEDSYICDISGAWYPELPFCVHQGSGLVLVDRPKIKTHDEYFDDAF